MIANLLALQVARRPSVRDGQTAGVNEVMRMVGKMIASRPEAVRARLRVVLDRDPSDEEVSDTAIALSSDFMTILPRNEWAHLFEIASNFVQPIFDMMWTRLSAPEGIEFVTADEPFAAWHEPDTSEWMSAGLLTAAFHTFPVSPSYCISLTLINDGITVVPNPGDSEIALDRGGVIGVNVATTQSAYRQVISRVSFDWPALVESYSSEEPA